MGASEFHSNLEAYSPNLTILSNLMNLPLIVVFLLLITTDIIGARSAFVIVCSSCCWFRIITWCS